MTLVKYEPMRDFDRLSRSLGSFLGSFEPGIKFETGDFLPKVDISETDSTLQIHIEMPGLTKDDFKVSINDERVLIIKGSKKRIAEDKGDEKNGVIYHRIERSCGEFTRSFVLPDYVNTDSINANFDSGVLNLVFEKTAPIKPKEIEISIN